MENLIQILKIEVKVLEVFDTFNDAGQIKQQIKIA